MLLSLMRRFSNSSSKNGGMFSKFAETIKQQSKDDELKASVEKLEAKLTEVQELEAVRKAKEILSKVKQNEAILQEVRERVDSARGKISDTVSQASKPVRDLGDRMRPYVPKISESEAFQRASEKIDQVEEDLLANTNIYQYGGFKTKEARERLIKKRLLVVDSPRKVMEENPDAGNAVELHKSSRWTQRWAAFKENNKLLQKVFGLKQTYDESNNIFIYLARTLTHSIGDRLGGLLEEGETAQAMREIGLRDPHFGMESFMRMAHEYLIPEILDAILTGDTATLRMWTSEGAFNLLKATLESQVRPGCRLDGRILDLRHIELVTARLLEETTPVLVLSFSTQQTAFLRDIATGAIVDGGREDQIETVQYVMALAKEPTTLPDDPTLGWKLVEIAIRND